MKTMLLVNSWWQGIPTFRMIPASKDCPYAEVIFINGPQKGMAVISQIEYEKLEMVPKLDAKGMEVPMKVNGGPPTVEKTRISMRTLYEYQILNKDEMVEFINMFGINSDKFDFQKYMDMDFSKPEEGKSKASGIVDKEGNALKIEKGPETDKKKTEVN